MKRFQRNPAALALAAIVVAVLITTASTSAQNPADELPDNDGRTAFQNVNRPVRTPGQMVRDGVIAANQIRVPQLELNIVETEEESIESLLLADTIDILFEQLVQAIQLFETLLRARAGLPPRSSSLLSRLPAAVSGLTRKSVDAEDARDETPPAPGTLVRSRLSSLRRPSVP